MPLTYDDREDLCIQIDIFRRELERLLKERDSLIAERDYFKKSYHNLMTYTQVLENGCKM